MAGCKSPHQTHMSSNASDMVSGGTDEEGRVRGAVSYSVYLEVWGRMIHKPDRAQLLQRCRCVDVCRTLESQETQYVYDEVRGRSAGAMPNCGDCGVSLGEASANLSRLPSLRGEIKIEHPRIHNAKYHSVLPEYPRTTLILFHRLSPEVHIHFTYHPCMLRVHPTAPLLACIFKNGAATINQ